MLHLHFAPSLDMLVLDLLQKLRIVWTDPFAAPDIIVPSPALGKWLRMRLADGCVEGGEGAPGKNGAPGKEGASLSFRCVANLKLPTIEGYLWKILRPDNYIMLDQHRMQQVVCALLDEECIGRKEFAPVRSYLTGSAGIDPRKRVQLAARIAHRFLEYEYNRPGFRRKTGRWEPEGIDGAWMKGKPYLPGSPDEPWQAELYRLMRRCFAVAPHRSAAYLTLPQLYRLRREEVTPAGAHLPMQPATVFMFGVTKVSHFHRNLLVEISQIDNVDLHVYLTNPCAEFWEDVNTSRSTWRRSWNRSSGNAGIPPRQPDDFNREEIAEITALRQSPDHRLLELWGKAGKENIFLWCQDAQWNFDYRRPERVDEETAPSTLLESLQYSLLRREEKLLPPAAGSENDTSLQILACPDRGREMEEIREQVLDLVKDRNIAMLNEVAVYVTDLSQYVPYIQRVFGCYKPYDPEYIPFCTIGTSGKDTLFAQGMKALLDIMQPRFDRAHVFELLRNPIVQATRGFSAEDVALWERWADALSIFRGYNSEQRREMGDTGLALTDAHTFELSIARMLVADLTEGAAALDFFENDDGDVPSHVKPLPVIPYHDFETSDRKNLETFCATVEELYLDGKRLRESSSAAVDDAVATMKMLVNRWMGKIPETPGVDQATEGGIQRTLHDGLDAISLQETIAGRAHIPFEEFITLVTGCLPDEGASTACAWTGGITFAPLRPSMVVPHNIIFVTGLDDVLFPGSNERPSWDLLSHKRIIGDSDRVRDNRFAFLEVLHAARKRLILSYRSRDMQKESELYPSSVVKELDGYLNRGKEKHSTCVREIPWIVHESLHSTGRSNGSWNRSEIELEKIARTRPKDRMKHRYDLAAENTIVNNSSASAHVTLYDLQKFFGNPLEYHLIRRLGIDLEEQPATASASDEPLQSGNPAVSTLQKAIWNQVLSSVFPEKQAAVVDDAAALRRIALEEAMLQYTLHAAAGHAPEAMMGRMEKNMLFIWADSCVDPILSLKELFPDHRLVAAADLSLGREGVAGTMSVPLTNEGRCTIECRHRQVLVPRRNDVSATAGVIAFKKEGASEDNPDLWLESVLQWLQEKRIGSDLRIKLIQLNRGNQKDICAHSSIATLISEDTGKEHQIKTEKWLADLIGRMVIGRSSEHLPFAEIQKLWPNPTIRAIAESLQSGNAAYRPYLAAFKLVEARLPDLSDEELKTVSLLRYAPMLEKWLIDKGDAS